MTEFKIGDRVKIVDATCSSYTEGDIGVVIEDPNGGTGDMICVLAERYDYEQVFEAHELELVND